MAQRSTFSRPIPGGNSAAIKDSMRSGVSLPRSQRTKTLARNAKTTITTIQLQSGALRLLVAMALYRHFEVSGGEG